MSVPESFICPISQQIMDDPYIDTDGNSYEKAAIMEWLATRQVSPITRRPLYPNNLVPNRGLKTLIDEFRGVRPAAVAAAEEATTVTLDRKPIMLFAVIDNSGSMGEACGGNANGEDDGFSRLDLVKHTMNTVITALSSADQLCLIKFSNAAEVIANLAPLSETNKKIMMEKMQNLAPEYSTNIWDGLRAALDIIVNLPAESVRDYNIEIFLLTDGVPNINPPRPITETLESYLTKKCPDRRPKVHTFGYGYSLQSDVLYDLAKVADGCFGFIPDSSMVGTVFINSLSSSLVGPDPSMQNAVIDQVCERFCALLRLLLRETSYINQKELLLQFIRDTEAHLEEARNDAGDARAIDFLESILLDCKESTDPNLGQIMKSIQALFFLKWGKHYLYSVLSAFESRVCINFKDKAMQIFKSEKFKVEQERIEEVFVQLPAPMPSMTNHQQYNGYYNPAHHTPQAYAQIAAMRAPVSMGTYHTAGGGCFSADSLVLSSSAAGVAVVSVGDLRAGDRVWSQDGETEVECVVKMRYRGPLYEVGCMKLTAYHPVMVDGQPCFPIERCRGDEAVVLDGYVYDVVLRNRSLLASPQRRVEGDLSVADHAQCMYVATFGHTSTAPCFEHAYFGSERVIADLKRHPAWATGYLPLEDCEFVREAQGEHRVVGIRYSLRGAEFAAHSELQLATAVQLVMV